MPDSKRIAEMVQDRAAEVLAPMQAEMDLNNWDADFRIIMWQAISLMADGMANDAKGAKKAVRNLSKT